MVSAGGGADGGGGGGDELTHRRPGLRISRPGGHHQTDRPRGRGLPLRVHVQELEGGVLERRTQRCSAATARSHHPGTVSSLVARGPRGVLWCLY